jgi:hypothetical protein
MVAVGDGWVKVTRAEASVSPIKHTPSIVVQLDARGKHLVACTPLLPRVHTSSTYYSSPGLTSLPIHRRIDRWTSPVAEPL